MPQNCYVKVTNTLKNEFYDVGPFINSGNDQFYDSHSAINWIYKQVGLIKVNTPDANLTKHRWDYSRDELGNSADIKIEISDFIFEIFNLISQDSHNVINELLVENKIPPGFI